MLEILKKISFKSNEKNIIAILVRGASAAFVVNILGTGLNFGVQVFLARLLGVDIYGDYIYVISWVSILVLICNLGFDTASLRFVSAYSSQAEWGLLRGFFRTSQHITIISATIISILTYSVVWLIRDNIGSELMKTFAVACLMLPVNSLLQVHISSLQALKHTIKAQAPQVIMRPVLLISGVFVIVAILKCEVSPSLIMAINMATVIIALLLVSFFFGRVLPKQYRAAQAHFNSVEWRRVAFPLFLISGSQLVLARTDILMVGALLGTSQSGIYAVASQIVTLIAFGITAVNTIVAPLISQLHAQGRYHELQRIVTMSARGIMAYSLPVAVFLLIFGKYVLALYGQAFVEGYIVLIILSIGQLVVSLAGSVGFLLTMTGHQQEAMWVIGGCALLNIILNAIFIPMMGVMGAAIATMLSTSARSLVLSVLVKRKLNIVANAIGV